MRIKKKYVIKEAILTEGLMVDDLGNLTPTQKKVLKSLYKKYVKNADDDFRYWRLNTNDITKELNDKWQMSFHEAYKISRLFVMHGDDLFKENRINSEVHVAEILRGYMGTFISHYKKSLEDDEIHGGDWDLSIGGEVTPHTSHFWDSYNGFSLYLPVNYDYRWELPRHERDVTERKIIIIKVSFDFGDYRGTNTEPTISIKYSLGDSTTDDVVNVEGGLVEKAYFDLPKEVSKESMNEWLDDLVANQIKPIVTDFKYPEAPSAPVTED